jgi:hypothetical protein
VIEFVRERQIICFAWEWLGTSERGVLALPDFAGYKRNPDDNKALIRELHKLISKADIVIGHNIDGFDDKRANTDFIKHGFPPPPPHKTIDTLKVARSKFSFNSNRLNDLGAFLGLGEKVKHGGFELWRGCMAGDPAAWALMKRYNQGDVTLLKRVYLKERPWIANHPNLTAKDPEFGCPKCGSKKVKRNGWTVDRYGQKPRFRCLACNAPLVGSYVKDRWRFK